MLIKIEFFAISNFCREVDVNQYWLRKSTEERSSQKRGLSIQA